MRMKIMIVDDHADMRRMLKTMLGVALTESFEIIECESGEEAVKEYPRQNPDCVLMDFEMHQMNGFQATKLIIDHDQKAQIIIVTGYDTPSMRRKADKLPIQGFVSKENLAELTPILQTLSIK